MNSRSYQGHAAGKAYNPRVQTAGPRSRGSGKKKKISRPVAFLRFTLVVLILLLVAVSGLLLAAAKPSAAKVASEIDSGTFFAGVSVNGVDIAGKSYAEAVTLVGNKLRQLEAGLVIEVEHKEKKWTLGATELKLTDDLDQQLRTAFSAGRSGSLLENGEEQNRIKQNGFDLDVTFTADAKAIEAFIATVAEEAYVPPTEPKAVAIANTGDFPFELEAGTPGQEVDTEKLYGMMMQCVRAQEAAEPLQLSMIPVAPKTSVEELKSVTKHIATFDTSFKGGSAEQKDRVKNIEKAADILNGAMVKPGESLSFNEFIGPRSEKGGWALAPGIINGKEYVLQAGGGICQVSTTLYNALLLGDVQVVNRKKHTWPSSYVPIGLDATVSTGGPDLVFKNNKDYPLYIIARADKENRKMVVSLYGQPLSDGLSYKLRSVTTQTLDPPEAKYIEDPTLPAGEEKELVKPRKGYEVEVYRDHYHGKEAVKAELLYKDKYRAIQGEYAVGTGGAGAEGAVADAAEQPPQAEDDSMVEAPVPGTADA